MRSMRFFSHTALHRAPAARALAALAACSLVVSPIASARAQTDTAPPVPATAAPAAATAQPEAPPAPAIQAPSRVGRLAAMSGTVSFHTVDEDHWDAATLNYPLTSGDALWTEPAATAAVEISASRISLASSTEFDLDQLDDHTLTATQAQGETFWDLRDLIQGDNFTLRTPRGVVTISAPGQYDVFSGDTQAPTTVSVIAGAAQVNAEGVALAVQAGQTATITGTGGEGDPFRGSTGPLVHTAFMDTILAPAAAGVPATAGVPASVGVPTTAGQSTTVTVPAGSTVTATATATATVTVTAPAIVRRMPGGEQLSHYGAWKQSASYGTVWHPQVAPDWVPYRDGHWAYVAPWGWTWIDDESWGFAPFHYGRWVQDDGAWAWAPTYYQPGYVTPIYAQPVYAPALVSFFGYGPAVAVGPGFGFGVGVGIGIGIGIGWGWGWGHIGWCPLGWGEPYHPWFNAGPGYYGNVNRYVTRSNTFYNNSVHTTTINNYANAATGSTVVPTSAMVNSQRVSSVGRSLSAANLSQAHVASGVPRPTGATQGITARAAQAQHLPNAEAASRTASPGPAISSRTAASPTLRSEPRTTAAGTAAAHGAPSAATGGAHQAGTETAATQRGAPGPAIAQHAASAAPRAGLGTTSSAAHPAETRTAETRTAETHQATTHAGLPTLRTAGATPRAAGGAPGPAIRTPAGENASATRNAASAPGPAITRTASANRAGLPSLRDHTTLASASGSGFSGATTRPGAFGTTTPGRAATPAASASPSRSYAAPRTERSPASRNVQRAAPAERSGSRGTAQTYASQHYGQANRDQGFGSRGYAQPGYARPNYAQPRYQGGYGGGYGNYRGGYGGYRGESAPRYQAPRYQAPHYQAPRSFGGGRRAFVP